MFGHQNDVITQDQKQDANVTLPEDAVQALTGEPETTPPTDSQDPAQSPPAITLDESADQSIVSPPTDPDFTVPADFGFKNTSNSSTPPELSLDEPADTNQDDSNSPESNISIDTPEDSPQASTTSANDDDLLSIKADALHDLSPLVNQLDLEPEEKFKTIMMLIQTSDDKTLIPDAYEIAKKIGDDKVKAQALLDVVNEINYFTNSEDPK